MQYIQLQPQIASQVPTPANGSFNFFLDVENNYIKIKGDSGEDITYSTITGGTYSDSTLTFTDSLGGSFSVTGITSGNASLISVTYAELIDLIATDGLIPSANYLITDFRTCYDQPDFNSYKNEIIGNNYKQSDIEPIIVFATSVNTISSTAYQPKYPKDKIQYDLEFGITERTSGVAYGRISERIDEFNNRTDYDHRTILFKRYLYIELDVNSPYYGKVNVTPTSGTEMNVVGTGTNFLTLNVGQYVGFQFDDFKAYEITNIDDDFNMTISGLTNTNLNNVEMYPANTQNNTIYYQNNISTAFTEHYTFDYNNTNVNNYVGDFANLYNYAENSFILANNVFQGSTYRNNTFGDSSYNNTFDDDCENNTIGNYFYNNSTDDDFDGNLIGNNFHDNRITSNFQYNRVGDDFYNNYLVQNSFYRNNIMNYFNSNVISGGDFQNNEIGSQFQGNVIRNNQFYKNDIGNGFNQNKIYYEFYGNLIGNGFNQNNIYCYFYDNTIGEYYINNTIGDVNNPSLYSFRRNRFGNYFNSNTIISNFYENQIGNGFLNNSISGETNDNIIGNSFENNTIFDTFSNNKIFNEFKGNITYDGFEGNNLASFISSNEFSGGTYNNNIGAYTFNNDFLGGVYNNTWDSVFYYNVISDGFSNNIFNTDFHNNTTGINFKNNHFVTEINTTDFTEFLGNITGFTYSALGTTATDNIYTWLAGTTNGNGVGATFNVEVSGGSVIGVSGNTEGKLYMCGNTITILGTEIGGDSNSIDTISENGVGKNGVDGTYIDLSATGGTGTNATFDISVSSGLVDGVLINNRGIGYQINDQLVLIGSLFGGTDGVDDITITVTALFNDDVVITVSGISATPSVYEQYNSTIFERKGGGKRLSYYDENDALTITNINE